MFAFSFMGSQWYLGGNEDIWAALVGQKGTWEGLELGAWGTVATSVQRSSSLPLLHWEETAALKCRVETNRLPSPLLLVPLRISVPGWVEARPA